MHFSRVKAEDVGVCPEEAGPETCREQQKPNIPSNKVGIFSSCCRLLPMNITFFAFEKMYILHGIARNSDER